MKFVGEIEIIKEYDDGYCQIVYQGKNTIAEGMAYALANVLTTISDDNLDNFGLAYFQVGIGNLSSNFPTNYTNKSFYQLQSPLSLSDYGSNTIQELAVLDHIVSENGNFQYPIEYTTTSAAFVGVTKENKTIVSPNGISTRLVLDKTMGNGKDISEVGLFINNADAYPNKNTPILAAYKSFAPITKTSDFNLIILWKIIVEDVGNNNLGFLGVNSKKFYYFEFTSGLGDLKTGTYQGDFVELGIPATYDYEGAPLVVAFHSLGSNQSQWRFPSSYREGTPARGPSSLYENVLDRGCFYLAVHGVIGTNAATLSNYGFFGSDGSSLSNSQLVSYQSSALYNHGGDLLRNWNSKQTFDSFYKILQYIVNHYPINRRRIYFFGFSMGGGCATSYASRMIDGSPSALNPAGVVALAPALNIKKVWWTGAPSSIGSTPYWPIPDFNNTLKTVAYPILYWTAGSGNPDAISDFYAKNNVAGPLWSTISSLTLSDVPLAFYENHSVDYNLVTSSDFSFSSCTFYNLRHIPYYLQYSNDDVVGGGVGGFLEEPCRILVSAVLDTGIHPNYKFMYSSLADISSLMINTYNVTLTGTQAIESHQLYALNQNDAIDFLFSSTYSPPLEASTIVTRSGKAWYFDITTLPDYNNNFYSSSYINSGLGVIVWKIDNNSNTLWVSGISDMIVTSVPAVSPLFNPELTEFNITTSNPLRCYNASSINCYPLTSGSTRRTRIQLDFNPSKVIFKPYINGNGTLDPVGEELKLDGTSYRIRPYTSGGSERATYDSSTKIFTVLTVGYYEIYP